MILFKIIIKFILDLIFPITCLNCNKEGLWLCQNCYTKIEITRESSCPLCKKSNQGEFCQNCQAKVSLNGLIITTSYENPIIQKTIQAFKYHNLKEISIPLSKLLITSLSQIDKLNKAPILNLHKNLVLTAVPLHKKRLLERGFNQAELLARPAARFLKVAFYPDLLSRKHYTEAQATLSKSQRLNNIKNAFVKNKSLDLSGKNVIIIDDVATTLATLNECAKILKKYNCQQVWGLVIARGN